MLPSFKTMKQYVKDTFLPYVTNFKNLLLAYRKHYDNEIAILNQRITSEANRLDGRINTLNSKINNVIDDLDAHASRRDNPHVVGFDQLKNVTISASAPTNVSGTQGSLWIQYLP